MAESFQRDVLPSSGIEPPLSGRALCVLRVHDVELSMQTHSGAIVLIETNPATQQSQQPLSTQRLLTGLHRTYAGHYRRRPDF
jgi:hypothetical protein